MSNYDDQFELIHEIFNTLYQNYESSLNTAFDNGNEDEFNKYHDILIHIGQSFYLYMFTRFEAVIRELSAKLIKENKQETDWKKKRAWTLFPENEKSDQITFKERVALLIDKGAHDGYYNEIEELQKNRNSIAHGSNLITPYQIPELKQNIIKYIDKFESNFK